MSLEQFKGGEVCYKLNGDQNVINWYQTIGEDDFPVLDKTRQVVFKNPDGSYGNQLDEDGIESLTPAFLNGEGVYNLSGQRVSKVKKGIYIVNGKKVLF